MKPIWVTVLCLVVCGACWAAQDANSVPIPRMARQTLGSQLLTPSEDWLTYYDVAPADTVQIYYNLWIYLVTIRQQQAQIQSLTARVAALEKKLAAQDPNKPVKIDKP